MQRKSLKDINKCVVQYFVKRFISNILWNKQNIKQNLKFLNIFLFLLVTLYVTSNSRHLYSNHRMHIFMKLRYGASLWKFVNSNKLSGWASVKIREQFVVGGSDGGISFQRFDFGLRTFILSLNYWKVKVTVTTYCALIQKKCNKTFKVFPKFIFH